MYFGVFAFAFDITVFSQQTRVKSATSTFETHTASEFDSSVVLQYAIRKPAAYSYAVQCSVSQSLGEMIDFMARTSANTEMQLSTEASASSPYRFHYSYGPGNVTLNGLSIAGIPDTNFTTSGSLIPEIVEFINANGKVVSRSGADKEKSTAPKRSEQLLQTLSQGARYFLLEFPNTSIALNAPWTIKKTDTISTNTGEGNSTIILNSAIDCKVSKLLFTNGVKTALIDCSSNALGFQGNVQQQGITMSIDGEGAAKGTYVIELHTGLPTEAQLSMEYQLRMAATGQENTIIPVTMTMDTKYSRTRTLELPESTKQKKNTTPKK